MSIRRSPRRGPIASLALLLALTAAPAAAVDIAQCGETVQFGDAGILLNDLSCAVTAGVCSPIDEDGQPCASDGECGSGACLFYGVRRARGATLDLAGFTVDGQGVALFGAAVLCDGRCEITGPGEVTGFPNGVGGFGTRPRIRISDVTAQGNRYGIYGGNGILRLTNVVADGNQEIGIDTRTLFVNGVSGSTNGTIGVGANRIVGVGLVASDNGSSGVIAFSTMRVANLTAVGNGGFGVFGGGARLEGSTVTGNQFPDVATERRPRLLGTTCGTSARLVDNQIVGDWDVCTND